MNKEPLTFRQAVEDAALLPLAVLREAFVRRFRSVISPRFTLLRTPAVAPSAPSTSGSQSVVVVTTDETVWGVLGGSDLPAITVGNVMTVTLVTVPVPATRVSEARPVSCAVMDSMDPPVKPVTAQSMGHVTTGGKVRVCVSVRPDGPETAVTFSRLRSFSVLHPALQKPSVGKTTPVSAGFFMRVTDSPAQWSTSVRSGMEAVLRGPSAHRPGVR